MKTSILVASLFFIRSLCFGEASASVELPKQTIRALCKKCHELESKITKLEIELAQIKEKEKMAIPVIRNVYEVLTRCFTVLFDVQRFSDILALLPNQNKNDFIRCSIIIKDFASYFKTINSKLDQSGSEIIRLKKKKVAALDDYDKSTSDYKVISDELNKISEQVSESREKNITQEDVVYHIATKCESIEELDAELEAENTVGVLKNTHVSSKLSLNYPVCGKIVAEFGDRGSDGNMIFYLGFETAKNAVVTSPVKGQIVFSGSFLNYKNMVVISNGEYRIFIYGIKNLFASIGDVVESGDFLGRMDGESDELPILKMELKKSGEPLDPRHWLIQIVDNGEKK